MDGTEDSQFYDGAGLQRTEERDFHILDSVRVATLSVTWSKAFLVPDGQGDCLSTSEAGPGFEIPRAVFCMFFPAEEKIQQRSASVRTTLDTNLP